MPLAGFEASSGRLSPVLVVLAGTVGSTLSAICWYSVSKLVGIAQVKHFAARHGRWLTLDPSQIDRADRWFDRWGSWAVFLGRMVPLVRTFVSYPAGISRMPMGRFLLFSTLGSLPWNAALIYAGFVVGENYPEIEAGIKPFEYVIYVVVAVLAVLFVARWWWGKRRQAIS